MLENDVNQQLDGEKGILFNLNQTEAIQAGN